MKGVEVGYGQVEVSMLQFADDTIVLCQASNQNVMTTKKNLRFFGLAAGLRVNYHKTRIGVVGVQSQQLQVYAHMLNCSQMLIPFKYIGIKVGGNPRKKEFWKEVVDKVRKKLSIWKGKKLTFTGRVYLIKSIFTTLLFFYFSLFKASNQEFAKEIPMGLG